MIKIVQLYKVAINKDISIVCGSQKDYKMKNTLYKEFIKHRTKEAENKYEI